MENQQEIKDDEITYDQWLEKRSQWYVGTLVDAGVHIDDVLAGDWRSIYLSCKVDPVASTETLLIKDKQIGEPLVMHPLYALKLKQQANLLPNNL